MHLRKLGHFWVAAALFIAQFAVEAEALDSRTVALRVSPAPGTDKDFFQIISPSMNNLGQTAIRAELCCPAQSPSDRWGIWSEGSGSLQLVARSSTAAPGIAGGIFGVNGFRAPALNDNGTAAFVANVNYSHTFGGVQAVYTSTNGNLQLLAQTESHAPGTPSGVNFFGITQSAADLTVVLNNAGDVAFRAELEGEGVNSANNFGIWSTRQGILTKVARMGDHPAGTPAGTVFQWVSDGFKLNDLGSVAFHGSLAGGSGSSADQNGVWIDRADGSQLVARTGDDAGDPLHPSVIAMISFPELNNSDQIALRGSVTGAGIHEGNDARVWRYSNGALEAIAREGDSAPGTPQGEYFANNFGQPNINDSGQIVLFSRLTGTGINSTNNGGIWLSDEGVLELIARNGDQVPGFEQGTKYSGISDGPFNNAGQLVFRATLMDAEGKSTPAMMLSNPGGISRILGRGEAFNVSNNAANADYRTITSFLPIDLNDFGQLLFSAQFTDFSFGLFVADLGEVPEPNSLALLVLGIALNCGRTNRSRHSLLS